jgi:AAHS family 4-hydroxybenzoate transporter-like MFS transporter
MVEISRVIEESKVRSLQFKVIVLCFFVMLFDGYDNAIISNAAPILMKIWNVTASHFGPVFSIATFGWMVGSGIVGFFADKIGRKKCLIIGAVIFALGTFFTIFVNSVSILVVLRFITGCGIGAAVPPAIVLTNEFSPSKTKATAVTVMFSGYVLGATVAAFTASWLLPIWGWHSLFVVGFIVPSALIALISMNLPESPRWLAVKGKTEKQRNELIKTIKKLDPGMQIDANTQFKGDMAPRKEKIPVKQLFEGNLATITILVWIYYIVSSLGMFFMRFWLPTLFVYQGYSVADASYWTGVTSILGIIGTIAVGFYADKFGFKWGALWPLLCTVVTSITGVVTGAAFIVAISLNSFFRNGEHSILTSLIPNLYPVDIRAEGDGMAISIAKIGGIVGPLVGGILISMNMSFQNLFLIIAAPFVICTICCFTLGTIYEKDMAPKSVNEAVVS